VIDAAAGQSGPEPQSRPDLQPGQETIPAWLYVSGVNGAPPPLLGLGPVRVSGEIRRDMAGALDPRIRVLDHELTAPTAYWPQVGVTLPILLSRAENADSLNFAVLWEAPVASHE
jgi:hypothetical protein